MLSKSNKIIKDKRSSPNSFSKEGIKKYKRKRSSSNSSSKKDIKKYKIKRSSSNSSSLEGIKKYNDYMKNRKKYFHFLKNPDDKCIVSVNNIIHINNSEIVLENNPIDYGATSIVFKATNKINNISYILKIMSVSVNEINFMKKSSKYVLNGITPHFIILHQNLLCSDSKNNNDMFDSTRFLLENKYSILIMEMFDGNVENLLSDYNDDDILLSIHAQIYISILSFHKILKAVHDDSQYKNFYYKKITFSDNDYFHYIINNKSVYIKNKGYLIVIADYGFSYYDFSLKKNKLPKKQLLEDYDMIINRDEIYTYKDYKNINHFDNEDEFFNYLINDTLYFKTIETLPLNSIILNNIPYII